MNEHADNLHGARRRRDLAAELGEHALRLALRDGLLTQLWPGVVVPRVRVLDLPTRAAAALLYVGADGAVVGRTAAGLFGCTAANCGDIHVTVPYTRRVRGRPGLVVHQGPLRQGDVVELLGLRVTALDLTVAEMLCTAPRRVALATADQAVVSVGGERAEAFLAAVQERLARRADRRGTIRAAVLLGLITGKADSPPESWLRLLVVDAGYPPPVAQHEVRSLDGRKLYVLDLAWPQLRIALEYDGYEAHEDREAYDTERDHRLAARGWIVIRVRAADMREPRRVLDELATAFAVQRHVA
ncbi:MAG: DUF559 domain-containing protein [Actinophytocola sp.]|uniref:endonuclease domain-containing protein n=1 Tax=Actinophytocola sp. TaxID=1872138 RepID=UPI0013241911|nr:DUF559 domain-containing protein [Actinophytocola sp.]MPZ86287.1 DUF559 domain-containing protein [Actinophytocola sp.]